LPWQDPPADPPTATADLDAQVAVPEELWSLSEEETLASPETDPVPEAAQLRAPRRRRSRIMMLPVALGAGLVAAAAYAYTAHPGAPARLPSAAHLSALAADSAAVPSLTPNALRQAFRARLAEVDLLRRFELTLDDHAWRMKAALDEEEAARFRRILASFVATHHIDFPVDVKIGGTETMLPFKVRQVVVGANASIVTDDGKRLYPGDDYRGVKLVAIDGNRISFNGAQAIEVAW
jgi:type III secretion protein D